MEDSILQQDAVGAIALANEEHPCPLSETPIRFLCVVCMEQEKSVVLLPCKHMCMCKACTQQILARGQDTAMCPVCRGPIHDIMGLYV